MSFDHFRPPEHFSPSGKVLFRLLCWVSFIIVMAAFAYFVIPLIDRYVASPFASWSADWIFGPDPQ